jgi:hypothetical protein
MKPWQDAMKSEQVLLIAVMTAVVAACAGCETLFPTPGADPLRSPYGERRVWAIAPLRNESGSLHADGIVVADHLARQLENAGNLDVLPVNRTLAAMQAAGFATIESPEQAAQIRSILNADAILVGTITAYDPYDPPKLGIAVELYADASRGAHDPPLDVRQLSRAPTSDTTLPNQPRSTTAASSVVSAFFDAADPQVRERLQRYANRRGAVSEPDAWRRYRVSMDLYTEFVSYVVSWRLLREEAQRIAGGTTQPAS